MWLVGAAETTGARWLGNPPSLGQAPASELWGQSGNLLGRVRATDQHMGDPSPCHTRPFRGPSSGNAPPPPTPGQAEPQEPSSVSAHPLLLPLLLSRWDSPLPCRDPPWLPPVFPNLHLPGGGRHICLP